MGEIRDACLVRGVISIEEICKLYSNLVSEERNADSFLSARERGMRYAYDDSSLKIPLLIKKAREHGLDQLEIFKEPIKKLREIYKL